ncbi:MAG: usg protein [Alphaproteobacteria bacterium]
MREIQLMLRDYRLTTVEILYHLPDHPHLLQSFVWQEYDIAPKFPVLHQFLDFWSHNLDGTLHSVRLVSTSLVTPNRVRHANVSLSIH